MGRGRVWRIVIRTVRVKYGWWPPPSRRWALPIPSAGSREIRILEIGGADRTFRAVGLEGSGWPEPDPPRGAGRELLGGRFGAPPAAISVLVLPH